ncbi:MAG: class I SAM-dependent methyltransferase [Anaerolineae bacterium]|nr:class I SAM-dependent methyltransferase [Anaerolineae bacterium]MCA9889176.1 class I SAM-dependent methyltransferase [Anaerolineae bacterium]MCA9893091.1 class I SAM-dependent methyltransferase [Anaerolineae bacterium]MCB9459451.1 class I SAM-dependent methyltransferase [Anaerolineaceae bacterium]
MATNYDILAPVYDILDFGNFADALTPRLVEYALRNDWMGRRIVSLGCGTGRGLQWIAQHGYLLTAVDQSEAMLEQAKNSISSGRGTVDWRQQNLLSLEGIGGMDMAIALNVLCEMDNLKQLEAAFQSIRQTLQEGRLFIFDLYTIEGLVIRYQTGDKLLHEADDLIVYSKNYYDFERQIQMREYHIYRRQEDDLWQRQTAERTMRAYPIQAVVALAKRANFDVATIVTPDLLTYDPGKPHIERVIMLAKAI